MYAGDGQAMLPRTPQKRTVIPEAPTVRPMIGHSRREGIPGSHGGGGWERIAPMHIPDGFLSAGVAAGTWAAGAGTLGWALRAERGDPERVPAGTLGALAGFVFAAQLVNVPLLPGTSGHLVGGMLAAALVGPWRGLVVMAVVLAVQALLFQDGGVTSFGANLLSMGGAGCIGGHAVASLVSRFLPGGRGFVAGPVAGAFVGTLVGAAFVASALALSGLYPASGVLPLVLSLHVPIALLEAALTGAVLGTVLRWRPDLVRGLQAAGVPASRTAPVLGALVVALAVAAFLAPFASPLPDGLESAAERLGFARAARAVWPAVAPGYSVPWAALGRAGTALAGVLGTLATAALAWTLSRGLGASRQAGPHR
jgi:cobalt/nickel transport system permease protein